MVREGAADAAEGGGEAVVAAALGPAPGVGTSIG